MPSVDWLEGTWIAPTTAAGLELAQTVAGQMTPLQRGARGYTNTAMTPGQGQISWSPLRPSNGVHLTLPATALAAAQLQDAPGLLRFLKDTQWQASRIDLAQDDKGGLLHMDTIADKLADRAFIGRAKKGGEITSWALGEEERGRTLQIGRRTSQQYMRIYDKAAEQHVPGPWIRVELELKHKRAQVAHELLLSQGPTAIPGMIRAFVDFTEPTKDTNRRRWPQAHWWGTFLAGTEKEPLTIPTKTRTLDDIAAWWTYACTPTAYILMTHHDEAWIIKTIKEAKSRLRPEQKALLPPIASCDSSLI